MNIFKMYTHYAICFISFVGGFSLHIFGSSGDCGPKLLANIVTPSAQAPDPSAQCCCVLLVSTLVGGISVGLYDTRVAHPNQMAECEQAGESQNWHPELRLLHKHDYNEMFVPHSARGDRYDRGELQCSASLAKILDKERLSKILGLVHVDLHQTSAAPKAQTMDEAQQAQGCSLLDQLEQQNQHSQQHALGVFNRILSSRSPSWPLKSFDNNERDINDFRVQLRCSNMPEEDVKRLASARASAGICSQLKSAKKQAQEEYDASTRVAKPTHEEGLRSRVHKAHLEKIDETMKKETCD